MYELTEGQVQEVGGGGPDSRGSVLGEIHPPGAWLDINSGPVVEVAPGIWIRQPGT